MEKSFRVFFVLLVSINLYEAKAQVNTPSPAKVYKLPKLDEHSLIRDSSGKRYDYTAWNSMVASGRYGVKVATLPNEKPSLIIGKLTRAEREEAIAKLPKPAESPYFKTGEPFKPFKENDINGQPIDFKQLAGKIVVINFWYISNGLCRRQISDLNELTETYSNDANVVFVAIAMDNKDELLEFLRYNPFKYRLIEKGKSLTSKYNITTHPTDIVIDQTGKIQYHSAGYSPASSYWIGKTITQLKTPASN